jgi:hypothetical protein
VPTPSEDSRMRRIVKAIIGEAMAPEAHLVNTRWFRFAVAAPITVALITAFIFTSDINLYWNLTPEGMHNFLNLFKLPIGISSLSLPLAAVVAANHRSMQTAKQILEQNSQNIFSNHLEHRRYFGNFMDERKPFKNIEVEVAALYELLFPYAVEGNLKPQEDLIMLTIKAIDNTFKYIQNTTLSYLSRENFKLPQQEIEVLERNVQMMEKSVSILIHPIAKYRRSDILEDQVKFIRDTVGSYHTIATGLEKCANFHRYLFETEKTQEIGFSAMVVKQEIHKFFDVYTLYKSFENFIDEYFEKDGILKSEKIEEIKRFKQRLSDVNENLKLNNSDKSMVETILRHHLPRATSRKILLHGPNDWENRISLN